MRPRGCLLTLGVLFGLALICCASLWFFGVPRLRDSIADEFANALSTEVADQLTTTAGPLTPGQYTLSLADLTAQIDNSLDTSGADSFFISVNPADGLSVGFTSGNQEFTYSGTPVARDGRLVMENMQVTDNWLGWFMPANRLGRVVEDGINGYFEGQNLRIDSLTLGDDVITFVVSPAPE